MRDNPGMTQGARYPVTHIDDENAREFVGNLNKTGDGFRYRIPTDAEWEYAARTGSKDGTFFGSVWRLPEYALFTWNGYGKGGLIPTGQLRPNPWGLYDVYGNAEEMVIDTRGNKGIQFRGGCWKDMESEWPDVVYHANSWPAVPGITLASPIKAAVVCVWQPILSIEGIAGRAAVPGLDRWRGPERIGKLA
jgi:formylglycine-generating enzyme required for sulfatase activity